MSRVDHLVARGGRDLRLETTPELTCCTARQRTPFSVLGPSYLIIPSYHLAFMSVSVVAPPSHALIIDETLTVTVGTADRPFRGNFIMDTFTTRWNRSRNRWTVNLSVVADRFSNIRFQFGEIIYNNWI